MQDVLFGVTYRPIPLREKNEIRDILATGNLTIDSLSKRGLVKEKREAYRKAILSDFKHHPDCTVREVVCLKRTLSKPETEAVRAIEAVKWRLFEGHVALLAKLSLRKLYVARWFTDENPRTLVHDIASESTAAFGHAVYRFNRYDRQFSTFLTTVVKNWLDDYCKRQFSLKIGDQLKDDISAYYSIKSEARRKGERPGFEEITSVILGNELRDRGIAETQRNVELAQEQNRERFIELRQMVCRRVVSLEKVVNVRGPQSLDFDLMLSEMIEHLSPLEKRLVSGVVNGRSFLGMAWDEGIDVDRIEETFRQAKNKIAATLPIRLRQNA